MKIPQEILVFVVEDDPLYRELLKTWLEDDGFEVETFATGADCLAELKESIPAAICLDLGLPDISGIDILRLARERALRLPILIISGDSRPHSIVELMKAGATDYLIKPVDRRLLVSKLTKAIEQYQEDSKHQREARTRRVSEGGMLVGDSEAMQKLCLELLKVSATDITVLLQGESGTGKELAAQFIHLNSGRRDTPFVVVNCAAIPESLFESEFFGHEKGSFTGAASQQIGYIEQADGGTLFLDEVGELPMHAQPKLLRVLQDKQFRRIGDKVNRRSDFRLISATNRNLSDSVVKGLFRQDLFFRLAVYEITLPPLRAMKEDISLLLKHFVSKFAPDGEGKRPQVPTDVVSLLKSYNWPGNVRELENAVRRALLTSGGDSLQIDHFSDIAKSIERSDSTLLAEPQPERLRSLDDSSRNFITQALIRHGGNISAVTRELNIGRPRFYRLMKKYGLTNMVNDIRYNRGSNN
jgi:two-component system NtrC family response regulator